MHKDARMTLSNGTYDLGPQTGQLRLHTGRAGAAAKAGHDLVIEAKQWSGTATVDTADPSSSSVEVTVQTASLEVISGTGGVKALTDNDLGDIRKSINDKILETSKNPTITFKSTRIEGNADGFSITGDLTIKGKTQPITLTGKADGGKANASGTITQSAYGIKQFSAMLGALKVADDVGITIELAL
jgi:polyisoprenoid-binding protein YceI